MDELSYVASEPQHKSTTRLKNYLSAHALIEIATFFWTE